MSKEREVIHEMIEEREAQVRIGHRQIDALYDTYGSQAMVLGGYNVHERITHLYDEILVLKTVLARSEDVVDTDQLLRDAQDKFGVDGPG